MDDHLQKIFDNVPEDSPRSRLEPYRELILRWRRQRKSYRRIRSLLFEHCNVKVAIDTLHGFVQRRSRPRKVEPEIEVQNEATPPGQGKSTGSSKPKRSPEEFAAQREAIRAAFTKPAPEVKPEYRFTFDESKPLTNRKY